MFKLGQQLRIILLLIKLQIIFWINQLVVLSIKCFKITKHAHQFLCAQGDVFRCRSAVAY